MILRSEDKEAVSMFGSLVSNFISQEHRIAFEGFTSDSAKQRRVPGPNNDINVLAQEGDKTLSRYFFHYLQVAIPVPKTRRGVINELTKNERLAKVADEIGINIYYGHLPSSLSVHCKGTIIEALVEAIYEHTNRNDIEFERIFSPLARTIMKDV